MNTFLKGNPLHVHQIILPEPQPERSQYQGLDNIIKSPILFMSEFHVIM